MCYRSTNQTAIWLSVTLTFHNLINSLCSIVYLLQILPIIFRAIHCTNRPTDGRVKVLSPLGDRGDFLMHTEMRESVVVYNIKMILFCKQQLWLGGSYNELSALYESC